MKIKIQFETEIPDNIKHSDKELKEWVRYSVKEIQHISPDNAILKAIGEAEATGGVKYYTSLVRRGIEAQEVIQAVSKATGVPVKLITGKINRKKDTALAKMVARKMIYDNLGLSLSHIGSLTGKAHHTTVMYSIRKVNDLIQVNDPVVMRVLAAV